MTDCKHEMIIDKMSYHLNDNACKLIKETLGGFSGTPIVAIPNAIAKPDPKLAKIAGLLDPDTGIPKKKVQEILDIIGA